MLKLLTALILLLLPNLIFAQQKPTTSVAIFHKIEKLAFLGKVMYVAAHPDDENQNVISYFSNYEHATTAYLSLTRGDGGQNLIGPQLREALGVIRTQELLGARSIDGGEQWFTRANDFGYSKNPTETFTFWNKEDILGDVVWAIRKFKPDVIINRFDHRTPGSTHGHHTTSAMLSVEAFDLAASAEAYPKQLEFTETHQPKRLYWNKSWWSYKNKEDFLKTVGDDIVINVGTYYDDLGISNTEIAAQARSEHKSQGFGSLSNRGERKEYFELIKGDKATADFFQGIDTSWNRVKNGSSVATKLQFLKQNFNFKNPSKNVPELLQIHKEISKLKNSYWKKEKLPLVEEIITDCLGLYVEASTATSLISPKDSLSLSLEIVNRSNLKVALTEVTFQNKSIVPKIEIETDETFIKEITVQPENLTYTTPYYLQESGSVGMYAVDDLKLLGKPENKDSFKVNFKFEIEGTPIKLSRTIQHKYRDRVAGEVYEPVFIVPEISVEPEKDLILFPTQNEQKITVSLLAATENKKGTLKIEAPEEWLIQPEKTDFEITKGNKQEFIFTINPPLENDETVAKITAVSSGNEFSQFAEVIEYDHIPKQQIMHNAEIRLVNFEIDTGSKRIAYIQGAGDSVDDNLKRLGLNITNIDAAEFYHTDLSNFDVVILGIRALNKFPELITNKTKFHQFAKKGGTVIVQYNTKPYRGTASINEFFPYEFISSRDRVTDENAKVVFLDPKHKVLNSPNKITETDFENWQQERGLYFPNQWGKEFVPILGMHDGDESEKLGSLLIAKHGKGHFVYSGLSFFRELPKGVTGAYRLLVNVINL